MTSWGSEVILPAFPMLQSCSMHISTHRVILTFDKDCGEPAVKECATPCPGVILIRIPKKNPAWIAEYVRAVIQSRKDWEGQFSVIEEDRVRMRSLQL